MVRPCCGVQISCRAVFHRWGGCLRFPRGGREHASFPGTAWAPLPFSIAPTGGSLCGASPLLPGQELAAAASPGTARWGVGHLLRLSCALSTRPPAVFPFSCFRAAFPAEPSAAWSAACPVLAASRLSVLRLRPSGLLCAECTGPGREKWPSEGSGQSCPEQSKGCWLSWPCQGELPWGEMRLKAGCGQVVVPNAEGEKSGLFCGTELATVFEMGVAISELN